MSFHQLLPIVTTLFASAVTVQLLYSLTNQKFLLILAFLIVLGVLLGIKDYIMTSLYPERKDGRQSTRRRLIIRLCDFLVSVSFVILTNIFYDIFAQLSAQMTMPWYLTLLVGLIVMFFVFMAIVASEEESNK